MNAAPFHTLKVARKLETSGFVPLQAAGVAEGMAEAASIADLAIKSDIGRLEGRLDKLEYELVRVEKDVPAEIISESSFLRHDIELLRRDIDLLGRDLTLRLGGIMVADFGLVLGAMRYMLAHP
jgi:hypothetical protein